MNEDRGVLPIVVSFGGGVQSTAILHLVLDGKLPRPDAWVFADTGDEPRDVNAHVETCKSLIESAGMELAIVKTSKLAWPLSEHVLSKVEAGERGVSALPMFVPNNDGGTYAMNRGCTRDFKTKNLDAWVKARYGIKTKRTHPDLVVERWIGISMDETQRMKDSTFPYWRYAHPLITMVPMRRDRIISYLRSKGIDAPRSACKFCPFHNQASWRAVKENAEDWAEVIEFERRVQAAWEKHGHVAGMVRKPWLHPSMKPIDTVDFGERQWDLFGGMDNECAGVCGV